MCDIAKNLQTAFKESKDCDVLLRLNSERDIKCHSLVLRLGGSFFQSRFSENWRESVSLQTVDCIQFEEGALHVMVNFMYGLDCEISYNNIDNILSCSCYFGVNDLTNHCEHFLINNISYSTCFKILLYANKYSLNNLTHACFAFLDRNLEEAVLASDDFEILPKDVVLEILKRKTLCVHEELMFDQLILWVEKNEQDWKELVPHVCFLSMSYEYFISKCVPLAVLDQKLVRNILQCLTSIEFKPEELRDEGLSITPRKSCSEINEMLIRCPTVSVSSDWQQDMLNGDRIVVSCDCDAKLKGVSIFGAAQNSLLVRLSVHETDNNNSLLSETKCRIDFGTEDNAFVKFKSCINFEGGKKYTMVLLYKGSTTFYGRTGLATSMHVKNKTKIKVTFETAHGGHTTVNSGQFHGFLFSS